MKAYVLSVLGIVLCGVIIDIILPSGSINKYIKSIYSVFVVAVLISPLINFFSNYKDIDFSIKEYEVNEKLMNYIYKKQAEGVELKIEQALEKGGFKGVDIIINFSIENNDITYNSCEANIKDLAISTDKQHINSYEFIREVVYKNTGLKGEVVMIYEW